MTEIDKVPGFGVNKTPEKITLTNTDNAVKEIQKAVCKTIDSEANEKKRKIIELLAKKAEAFKGASPEVIEAFCGWDVEVLEEFLERFEDATIQLFTTFSAKKLKQIDYKWATLNFFKLNNSEHSIQLITEFKNLPDEEFKNWFIANTGYRGEGCND